MDNSIKKQILLRVLISAPVIAFLVVTPMYLVFENKVQPFFDIWMKMLVAALIWWSIQIMLFHLFKKRNYPKWTIGITAVSLIIVTYWNPIPKSLNKFIST